MLQPTPEGSKSIPAAAPDLRGRFYICRFAAMSLWALSLPVASFAAGADDPLPPKTTQTTTQCSGDEIYDEKTKTCIPAQDSRFDDDIRYQAVRELAYAGAYLRARDVLETLDPDQSRAPTYRGFLSRKLGHPEDALAHYFAALELDPDNILARSYLGEAYLEMGDRQAAERQLSQIRTRGGADSWAEHRLLAALSGGALPGY